MEPKRQRIDLADKPKEMENGPDDGEIGKSHLVMQCALHIFYCVSFHDTVGCIIRDEF